MNVILCLDNKQGLLFNNRRQSRDKAVIEDMFNFLGEKMLFVSPFSEKLFQEYEGKVTASADFPESCSAGEFFFSENAELAPLVDKIEEIVVYRWNRDYPADFYCDIDFSLFELASTAEFKGYSHEIITKEIFIRGNNI